MTDDETKLLPCPFCGGTLLGQRPGEYAKRRCRLCNAEGPFTANRHMDVAWNTRAPDPRLAETCAMFERIGVAYDLADPANLNAVMGEATAFFKALAASLDGEGGDA